MNETLQAAIRIAKGLVAEGPMPFSHIQRAEQHRLLLNKLELLREELQRDGQCCDARQG